MDYVRARLQIYTPNSGDNDYQSMYPDLLIEHAAIKDGAVLSLTMFNSKDGTKTPVGELTNILKKDSRSVKISVMDLSSLYLLRNELDIVIALAEKNKKEAALKGASS